MPRIVFCRRWLPLFAFVLGFPATLIADDALPAPPTETEQASTLALVREVYKDEYVAAQTSEKKRALAEKMLAAAAAANEPTEKFVLLQVAADIAADAGDASLALSAIDRIVERFAADAIRMKARALSRTSKAVQRSDSHQEIVARTMQLFDEALATDRFDLCRPLADLARQSARKARDGKLLRIIDERLEGLDAAEQSYAQVKESLEVLNSNPTDPRANLVVGAYRAFSQNDWQAGVPMLALSDKEIIKAAALLELQGTEDPLTVGDAWWEVAADYEGRQAENIQSRAASWYRKALPKLGGLNKARIEKRLATVKSTNGGSSASIGTASAGIYGSRTASTRSAQVRSRGGNAASEAAVALALKWLAAHQLPDGGWDLDHRKGPGVRSGRDPGDKNSRNGATALALLPFLGAGYSHKEGTYKKEVGEGLRYLVRSIKLDKSGGSLVDSGNMYAHGLASIALCEAYGMTNDRGLAAPAQAVVNFIHFAQDPAGGGWRYQPRQSGDTSVVGWQLTVLKTAQRADLNVSPNAIAGAVKFLDSVQTNGGAAYGYATPGSGAATSAIGLLCRQYTGWKQDHEALQKGVATIVARGPSRTDLYFNYYASQVLLNATGGTGKDWQRWNTTLRDLLVTTQAADGADAGSWFASGGHANSAGGRLYCTAMAALALEVYYRNPPIYEISE